MLHKTDYGLVYNDDGSLCVTHQEDGAVTVEEGTTNLVNNPFFENDWASWSVQNATNGSTRTIKEVEGAYGGKVAVLDRPAGGGNIGIFNGCGGLTEGDIVTVSFRARRTKGTSNVRIRWGGGTNHTVPISGEWGKYEITMPKDGNSNIVFEVHSDDSIIELDATQVETKPFATSFVDGSRLDGILAYPIALKDDYTIACYRKSNADEDYRHVVKRSDGKVFVDGVEDSGYEVGWIAGRNLIQRQYMLDWAGVVTDTDEIGHYYEAHISSLYPIAFPNLEFEENTQYTISGKVKWISGNANGLYFQYSDGTTQTIFRLYNTESVKEFSVTSAKGKTVTGIGAYWSTGGKTRYYNLKLEKGSTATHWTPAPEDLGYGGDLLMLSNHTGHIKDLKILPYIATDKEIKQMYSGGTFDVTDKGIVIADNYSEVGPMNGIIAWWPLDGHTDDYSGNNNHATNNGATITSGIRGSAYSFNGSSSYIRANNVLNQGDPFSISFWAKISGTSTQCLGCTRTATGNGMSIFIISNKIRFDTDHQWTTGYTVPRNEWIHITLTQDHSGKRLYVNSLLEDSTSSTGSMSNLSSIFQIGASHSNGSSLDNYLDGIVCDYRIYNRALSPEEIKSLYDATKPNAIPMQLSNDGTVYLSGELKEA